MKKLLVLLVISTLLTLSACSKKEDSAQSSSSKAVTAPVTTEPAAVKATEAPTAVIAVSSIAEFDSIIASNPERLFLADMYADWCKPCHMLAPVYAELSLENTENATFLKVDIEKYKELAQRFKVQGIPFVAFIKAGALVDQQVGVANKSVYQQKIDALK